MMHSGASHLLLLKFHHKKLVALDYILKQTMFKSKVQNGVALPQVSEFEGIIFKRNGEDFELL